LLRRRIRQFRVPHAIRAILITVALNCWLPQSILLSIAYAKSTARIGREHAVDHRAAVLMNQGLSQDTQSVTRRVCVVGRSQRGGVWKQEQCGWPDVPGLN
jgi:hypothetical protein